MIATITENLVVIIFMGDVRMNILAAKDGTFAGVEFGNGPAIEPGHVPADELPPEKYLARFVFKDPKSIDVVIAALIRSKEMFLEAKTAASQSLVTSSPTNQ